MSLFGYTPGGSPIFWNGTGSSRRRTVYVKCGKCGAGMPKKNLKRHQCRKTKPAKDDPLHPRNL